MLTKVRVYFINSQLFRQQKQRNEPENGINGGTPGQNSAVSSHFPLPTFIHVRSPYLSSSLDLYWRKQKNAKRKKKINKLLEISFLEIQGELLEGWFMRHVLSTWTLLPSHVFVHLIPSMIFLTGTAWLTQASSAWLQALLGLAQTQDGWKWWRLRKGFNTVALTKEQNGRGELMMPHKTIKPSGKVYSFLYKDKIRCWIHYFTTTILQSLSCAGNLQDLPIVCSEMTLNRAQAALFMWELSKAGQPIPRSTSGWEGWSISEHLQRSLFPWILLPLTPLWTCVPVKVPLVFGRGWTFS